VKILPKDVFLKLNPKYGIVLAFNDKGKIVLSLHDPSGKFSLFSEIVELDHHLLLGSWFNDWIVVVDGKEFLPVKH